MFRDFCIKVNSIIERFMFLLTPIGVCTGLILGERIGFLQPYTTYIFAAITFIATLSITFSDFAGSLKLKPILSMLFCNHVIIPFFAWLVLRLFVPTDSGFFMGMMLIFAGPCSTTSCIWAGITGGNKSLSTAFVVIDTMLCCIFTPAILNLACGTKVTIDMVSLGLSLVKMVMVPAMLSMVISSFVIKGNLGKASPYIKLVTKCFLLFIIVVAVSGMASRLSSVFSLRYVVLMISILVLLLGCFFFGLVIGHKVLRMDFEDSISMSLVMGTKNLGLDMILASQLPDPISIVPPMIAFFFLDVMTAIISRYLQDRKKALEVQKGSCL